MNLSVRCLPDGFQGAQNYNIPDTHEEAYGEMEVFGLRVHL